jgi:thiol-disulfide isomerase/thioredoxin
VRKPLLFAGALVITLGASAAGYNLYRYIFNPAPVGELAGVPEHGAVAPRNLTGTIRPDFALPDLTGQVRHVSEWDGQVVAINFWATWCPPCMKEIPEFIALQDKYAGRGLQFVGIALHNADEIQEFVAKLGMNYPVLVGQMEVIDLASALGNDMGTLPYTVFIDRHQRINFIKNGQLEREQAEAVITGLL